MQTQLIIPFATSWTNQLAIHYSAARKPGCKRQQTTLGTAENALDGNDCDHWYMMMQRSHSLPSTNPYIVLKSPNIRQQFHHPAISEPLIAALVLRFGKPKSHACLFGGDNFLAEWIEKYANNADDIVLDQMFTNY